MDIVRTGGAQPHSIAFGGVFPNIIEATFGWKMANFAHHGQFLPLGERSIWKFEGFTWEKSSWLPWFIPPPNVFF